MEKVRHLEELKKIEEVKIPLRKPSITKNDDFKNFEEINFEDRTKALSKFKIIWAFVSFLISAADVTVILYLSYIHFSHSSDILAWLMPLPILLNFIGIFTFLSNEAERRNLESLGCKRAKNLMFFPVIGQAFSALRLFIYAFEEVDAKKFERLESLLTRMKQYESFFRAAPEAFIQITFRIITWSSNHHFEEEDYWNTICIALCLFTLAESHMYSCIVPYYRMFTYVPKENAWSTEHVPIKWRVVLFIFTYNSIGGRIIADSIQKATTVFYFNRSEVIIVSFLLQLIFHAGIYGIFNTFFASSKYKARMEDEGVYGAFTYAWRSVFILFDFESYRTPVFLWFYIESLLMIIIPYIWIYGSESGKKAWDNMSEKEMFHIYSTVGVSTLVLSILLRFLLKHRWERKEMGL